MTDASRLRSTPSPDQIPTSQCNDLVIDDEPLVMDVVLNLHDAQIEAGRLQSVEPALRGLPLAYDDPNVFTVGCLPNDAVQEIIELVVLSAVRRMDVLQLNVERLSDGIYESLEGVDVYTGIGS